MKVHFVVSRERESGVLHPEGGQNKNLHHTDQLWLTMIVYLVVCFSAIRLYFDGCPPWCVRT